MDASFTYLVNLCRVPEGQMSEQSCLMQLEHGTYAMQVSQGPLGTKSSNETHRAVTSEPPPSAFWLCEVSKALPRPTLMAKQPLTSTTNHRPPSSPGATLPGRPCLRVSLLIGGETAVGLG